MSDYFDFMEMLDRGRIPYNTSVTYDGRGEKALKWRWITVFDPSGEPMDFKFDDRDGRLISIATENTP